MKKIIILCMLLFAGAFFCYHSQKSYALPNPWIECGDDIYCGAQKAGFNLPLRLKKYSVRAMKDVLEITFPLDWRRTAVLRKSQSVSEKVDSNGIADISGVYYDYPVNKSVRLKNGVAFNVRGDKKKFYVVNFAAESGYYSIYCEKGMKLKDINYFYKLLEEAEAPRLNFDEAEGYSIEKLMELRKVDGIVEPVYTQDCFPRTLRKKGVTEECFERANLGQDTFCTASQIKMIKDYYKKGQDKDPLNDGRGNFCAE